MAFVLTLVIDLTILAVPIYDMQLYDRILMSRNMDTLAMLSAACVVGLAFYAIFDLLRSACFVSIADVIARRLHGRVLETAIRQAASGNVRAGPQMAQDINEVHSLLISGSVAVPLDALCAPMFVAVLFLLHPAFGWLALTGIAGLLCAGLVTQLIIHPTLARAQDRRRLADHRLARSLAELELTEGQGMFPAIVRHWSRRYGRAQHELALAGERAQLAAGLARLLRLSLQAGVMAVGAVLIVQGKTTPGSLMGANLLIAKCLGPFDQLVESCRTWLLAHDAWRRIRPWMTDDLRKTCDARPGAELPGLVVREARVTLPDGEPLLEPVNLHLLPGTLAVLAGANGGGKSTLMRLLAGIGQPSSGCIVLDGQPIVGGAAIGYLPQSVDLMDATVAENIGRLDPDLHQVFEAAQLVAIHESIGRLSKGYETPLGPGAGTLSGGMRQRVGLARALYGKPRLILLDEPDANLDGEASEALIRALDASRAGGAIIVVISHRAALRQGADVVLEIRNRTLTTMHCRNAPAAIPQLETA